MGKRVIAEMWFLRRSTVGNVVSGLEKTVNWAENQYWWTKTQFVVCLLCEVWFKATGHFSRKSCFCTRGLSQRYFQGPQHHYKWNDFHLFEERGSVSHWIASRIWLLAIERDKRFHLQTGYCWNSFENLALP